MRTPVLDSSCSAWPSVVVVGVGVGSLCPESPFST